MIFVQVAVEMVAIYCGFRHSHLAPATIGPARASTAKPTINGDHFYSNLYFMYKHHVFTLFSGHVLQLFIGYLTFYVEIAI